MSRCFKRMKTTRSTIDDLGNPLVIELVVPFLSIVDIGRVASVNRLLSSHVRGRLLYEQKNSNFPQSTLFPKGHLEVNLRLDVVKVPPAFVTARLAKDGKESSVVYYDPRGSDGFDSWCYMEKTEAIEEYGEKFKLFYDSLPKPALPFSARRHFENILSKSQAALGGSHHHYSLDDDGGGNCDKNVELVIRCVKERYFSREASRRAVETGDPAVSSDQLFILLPT